MPKLFSNSSAVLVALTIMLASLPFGQIVWIKLPGLTIHAFEVIYLAMFAMLIVMNADKIPRLSIANCFLIMSVFYGAVSVIAYNIPISAPVIQLRGYFPFMVAAFVLGTNIAFPTNWYISLLIAGAGISATTALVIHHFYPEILVVAYAANDEVVSIADWGRMVWGNSMLIFLLLLAALVKEFHVNKYLLIAVGLISMGAIINTVSRSTIIFLVLLTLGSLIFSSGKKLLRKLGLIAAILFLSYLLTSLFMQFDPRLENLIKLRFLGGTDGDEFKFNNIYDEDFVKNRFPMYDQYLDNIIRHLFMGQGLGVPILFSDAGIPVFSVDISVMGFLIPFGIGGALLFFWFIKKIYFLANYSVLTLQRESRRVLQLLIVLLFLMSFNVDLFIRNNIVIYLVLLLKILLFNENVARSRQAHDRSFQ